MTNAIWSESYLTKPISSHSCHTHTHKRKYHNNSSSLFHGTLLFTVRRRIPRVSSPVQVPLTLTPLASAVGCRCALNVLHNVPIHAHPTPNICRRARGGFRSHSSASNNARPHSHPPLIPPINRLISAGVVRPLGVT